MANKYNDKLTPELQDKFCEAIEKGHSIEGACGYVGIAEQTYYNWCKKGNKSKSGKHYDFCCAVSKAESKATQLAEQPIVDAIPTDANLAKWWLVKRRPRDYGDKTYNETKVDANVKTELLAKLERPLPELKDD